MELTTSEKKFFLQKSFENQVKRCVKCALICKTRMTAISGEGDLNSANIIFLFDPPNKNQDMIGKLITDENEKLFNEIIE
jgi:hypothetical protein